MAANNNAADKIRELEAFRVEDTQPNVEALSEYICYEIGSFNNPLSFADRDGFQTRFAKEADHVAKLQEILEAGEYFVQTLYTYRSVSRALPNVKSDAENKAELYRKFFEVLDPEIKKIRNLKEFFGEAIDHISRIVIDVVAAEKRKEIPSDTLLDYLIRVLDMILKLDALKNMKAALANDFATLKRAIQFMNREGLDAAHFSILDIQSDENIRLYEFLSKPSFILKGFRDSLSKVNGFEEVISLLVTRCLDNFEGNRFLFCDEKFSHLRVCVLCVFLIDGGSGGTGASAQSVKTSAAAAANLKKLESLPRLWKHLKRYPSMPLYGDMTFVIKPVLKQCPNVNENDWMVPQRDEQRIEQQYLLVSQAPAIRKDFITFMTRFSLLVNKIKNIQSNPDRAKDIPEAIRTEAKTLCEQGIQYIAGWTSRILEQSAWKYSHPAALSKLETSVDSLVQEGDKNVTSPTSPAAAEASESASSNISDYERVVRFNYSAEERAALVDVIAMIKGLEGTLLRHTGLVTPLIKEQIHYELQEFVQETLCDMLVRTKKKKRPIHTTVLELRNIAADWLDKPPVEITKKKDRKPGTNPEWPKRKTGPGFTQLHMVRAILSTLYSDRSPGMQKRGMFSEKDFSDGQVQQMQQFYDSSFIWTYLLNYNATLRRASDLAGLWYREFYLEISKRIQFPIEMSLPWILTEDIIEKRNTTLMESIIYPLALYNDAAYRALFVLQRRFLYDEIEAEVNLVFDQLVYKLSEQIYAYFKIVASNITLDTKFRVAVERMQKVSRWNVPKSRYDVILSLRHLNILGRVVDLNYLIGQRINFTIRDNLLKAIQKFESSSILQIVEFEHLIDTVRVTHALLSQHIKTLDSFESLLADANESTSAISLEGRIARHICEELIFEIFPFHNFNTVTQRFILAPARFSNVEGEPEYERDKPPRMPPYYTYGARGYQNAFSHLHDQYKTYFGAEHIQSLIRLVGQASLALIIETCISFFEEKVVTDLSPYIATLMEAIPPQVKLQPASAYGLFGVFSYFKVTFRDFIDYDMLKPGVFQSFKIIGNCVAFLTVLENALAPQNIAAYMCAAPFVGIKPLSKKDRENRTQEKQKTDDIVQNASTGVPTTDIFIRVEQPDKTPIVKNIAAFVTAPEVQPVLKAPEIAQQFPQQALRAAKAYNPPRASLSLFKYALERISMVLNNVREEWKGTSPPDRLQKLDSSKEFYRLWGVLQFVFCLSSATAEKKSDWEFFGDGFFWGGCTIVYLFGQQLRFDAFNFTDHILNTCAVSPKGKEQIAEFLANATEVRQINTRVFNTLRTYLPMAENSADMADFVVPESEDFTKVKIVAKVDTTKSERRDSISSTISSFSQLSKSSLQTLTSGSSSPVAAGTPPPPPVI